MPLATLIAAAVLVQIPQASVTDEKVGEGAEAKIGDVVTLNYVAKVLDGQILDSTKMTPPFAFVLGARDLIQGYARIPFPALDKAISGMKVGGRRKIVLPGELAFGDLMIGDIPAGSKLTFEVELFDVRAKDSEAKLKIEELKEGVGEAAAAGDTIEAHYNGTFLNGRPFDTSRGRPTEDGKTQDIPINVILGVSKVIAGFEKGLTGMKAGGKRRVTIPYDMAYGKAGRPPVIPPYATLVFELEALRVVKKP
jgi:peptidylprolyl isomerase